MFLKDHPKKKKPRRAPAVQIGSNNGNSPTLFPGFFHVHRKENITIHNYYQRKHNPWKQALLFGLLGWCFWKIMKRYYTEEYPKFQD